MKKIWIFLWCFLVGDIGMGQPVSRFAKPIKDTINHLRDGEIYFHQQMDDSTATLFLYLMNRTDKKIKIKGFNERILLSREAKSTNDNWYTIDWGEAGRSDLVYGGCFPPRSFYLPPNHFISKSIPLEKENDGDFNTQMRYFIHLEEDTIYSKSFSVNIDSERFIPYRYRKAQIDKILSDSTITYGRKQQYKLFYIHFQKRSGKTAFAIRELEKLIDTYPDPSKIRSLFVNWLMAYSSKNENLEQRYIALSIAIDELSLIDGRSKDWGKIQSRLVRFKKSLPLRSDFLESLPENCYLENEDCYCQYSGIISRKVKMRFME